jgi:hypothetical protein
VKDRSARNGWHHAGRCESNQCVEVKIEDRTVSMRESRVPDGHQIVFTTDAWRDFLAAVKRGEFDLP